MTRRAYLKCVSVAPSVLCLKPGIVLAQALSTMYSQGKVSQERTRLDGRVNELYRNAYQPSLLPDEQRALAGLTINTATDGDPVLGYYSDYRSRTVTMPAVSLLFFEDLSIATAWLQINDYRLETVEEYAAMLKYKRAIALGRYTPPCEALGIPPDAISDPRVNELSLRIRNTGWAFVLGHEMGHVRFQHRNYDEVSVADAQANEQEADRFALELMRRLREIPMGGLLLFQMAIYYFENRADFDSDQEWKDYVQRVAHHPVTARRLLALSERLKELAPDFAVGQPDPAAAIQVNEYIAGGFTRFAKFLGSPDLQRVMRSKAERSTLSSLAPRRTTETLRDFGRP